MNLELEVKAKCPDLGKIKKQLKKIGAKFIAKKHQVDTYFLISPKYYCKTGPRMRIREDKSSGLAWWEYHEPIDGLRAKENEIAIDDPRLAKWILTKLGYQVEAVIDKVREKYKFGELNIDLDQVKGWGNFVEVEIMNNGSRSAEKKIFDFLARIGIAEKNLIPEVRYLDMVWGKLKKNKKVKNHR